jgi:ribosomal protein S17
MYNVGMDNERSMVVEFLDSIRDGEYGDFTYEPGRASFGTIEMQINTQKEIDVLSKIFKDKNLFATGSARYNPAPGDIVKIEVSTDSSGDKKFSFSSGSKSFEVKYSDYVN